MVKNPPANAGAIRDVALILWSGRSPGGGNGTHSSILAWEIPWTEESGGLQSIGLPKSWTPLTDQTTTAYKLKEAFEIVFNSHMRLTKMYFSSKPPGHKLFLNIFDCG